LLVIPKGQRVDAAPGTLPILEGQEALLLRPVAVSVIGVAWSEKAARPQSGR